jgi:anaerobic C4-dicarboxylate transporter
MEAKIMWTTIIAIAVITTLLITMLMASISKMKTPDEKRQDDEEQLRYLRNLYIKKDTKRAW